MWHCLPIDRPFAASRFCTWNRKQNWRKLNVWGAALAFLPDDAKFRKGS